MAWIESIHEDFASGELAEVYSNIRGKRGKLSNIMRIHSLNPAAMRAHMSLYRGIMFGEAGLSRGLREAIAVVVSGANGCEYCLRHHSEALGAHWSAEMVEAVSADYRSAELSEPRRTALDYAAKLTESPGEISESDIDRLRVAGFSDAEILNINLATAYFNFVNRIAMGLGVEFSEEEATGYKY